MSAVFFVLIVEECTFVAAVCNVIAFGCYFISVISRTTTTQLVTAISRLMLSLRVQHIVMDRVIQPCFPLVRSA